MGKDGEPELVLFDDVGGYGWNVPKSDWINVGCGTLDATATRDAWRTTHDHLRAAGHLPPDAEGPLEHVKGHSYFLFEPVHLDAAYRDGALLVGDSLGLAHPITAEGILPATVSGRRAAEAILAGDLESYPARLRRDPVLADYRRVHSAMAAARKLRDRIPALAGRSRTASNGSGSASRSASGALSGPASGPQSGPASGPRSGPATDRSLGRAAIARGFAWMFSGARLPAPRLLDLVLGSGD
jgi:flavin-dependent dehydrogenase